MTNVFRPDVLASSIQQLLDMAELPMLLMRSVIQSVTLYKGLSGFVIGILAKLISRKIWEMPKLWEGFIRSVKVQYRPGFADHHSVYRSLRLHPTL